MNLINLTPHELIFAVDGSVIVVAPSGSEARCSSSDEETHRINGIPVYDITYGVVTGLPEPEEDTVYVVSAMVKARVPYRTDVMSPARLIRDEENRVIGAAGLIANVYETEEEAHV